MIPQLWTQSCSPSHPSTSVHRYGIPIPLVVLQVALIRLYHLD